MAISFPLLSTIAFKCALVEKATAVWGAIIKRSHEAINKLKQRRKQRD